MKLLRRWSCALIVLAGVGWSGPAAADLFSLGLVPDASHLVSCSIVNLGKKPLEVTIQVMNADDGSVLSTSPATLLAPGVGTFSTYAGGASLQYCAFRGHISARSVRAAATLISPSTAGTLLALPVQ